MGVGEQIVLTRCKHGSKAGQVTGAKADDSEVAKAGLGEDNTGNDEHATGDQSTDRVGEDMLEHNAKISCAKCSCNQNILLVLKAVELHSGSCRHTCPSRQEEGDE